MTEKSLNKAVLEVSVDTILRLLKEGPHSYDAKGIPASARVCGIGKPTHSWLYDPERDVIMIVLEDEKFGIADPGMMLPPLTATIHEHE